MGVGGEGKVEACARPRRPGPSPRKNRRAPPPPGVRAKSSSHLHFPFPLAAARPLRLLARRSGSPAQTDNAHRSLPCPPPRRTPPDRPRNHARDARLARPALDPGLHDRPRPRRASASSAGLAGERSELTPGRLPPSDRPSPPGRQAHQGRLGQPFRQPGRCRREEELGRRASRLPCCPKRGFAPSGRPSTRADRLLRTCARRGPPPRSS